MATPTYKPTDAIEFARTFVKGIPVEGVDSLVCDNIQSIIWDFFPWNFTLKQQLKVGGAFLADKVQDITGVPTDFYRLIWARLTRTDLSDGNHYVQLTPADRLEPADPDWYAPFQNHEFIAYHPDIAKFRLEAQLQIVTGTELTQLDIEYQKAPTKITETVLGSVFTDFPDWFFHMFSAGVMWQFMNLANDKRQGMLQTTKKGGTVYTGQMGVFYNAMIDRAFTERQFNAKLAYPAGGSVGAVGRGNWMSGNVSGGLF